MNSQTDPIEDALRTYPLAELPPGFSSRVLREVRSTPAQPKFRLTWMDYALGLFITLLTAAGFVVWTSLPRQFLMRLQFEWFLLQQPRIEDLLLPSLAVGGCLLFIAFLVAVRLLFQPRTRAV